MKTRNRNIMSLCTFPLSFHQLATPGCLFLVITFFSIFSAICLAQDDLEEINPIAFYRCDECYSVAATDASCIDNADVACLCEQNSDEFRSLFTSCIEVPDEDGRSCPTPYFSFLDAKFQYSCSHWSAASSIPGCTKCQFEVASEIGCDDPFQHTCLCTVQGYLASLTTCITNSCEVEEQETARQEHSAVCAVLSSGNAATVMLPASETGNTDGNSDDDDNDGPDMTVVIGVVAGSVAALVALLVGGYFLFRKRSKRISKKTEKPPALPPRPPKQVQPSNGTYELWAYQPNPHKYHFNQPPLPYRLTHPSEVHGQPLGAPMNGYAELGPSRL